MKKIVYVFGTMLMATGLMVAQSGSSSSTDQTGSTPSTQASPSTTPGSSAIAEFFGLDGFADRQLKHPPIPSTTTKKHRKHNKANGTDTMGNSTSGSGMSNGSGSGMSNGSGSGTDSTNTSGTGTGSTSGSGSSTPKQ